jgi:hypothetical protein
MSGSDSFDDQVERLRIMLSEQEVWEEPEPPEAEHRLVLVPQPEPLRDADIFNDPEDDEKMLSADHIIGGRLGQLVDSGESESSKIIPLTFTDTM